MTKDFVATSTVTVLTIISVFCMILGIMARTDYLQSQKELKNLQKQAVELGYATNIVEYVGDTATVNWKWNIK